MTVKLRSLFFFLAVILLSFWAIKPFFHPGFFPVHDDTQVARVYEMSEALKSGQFPVRLVAGLGYGYGYPIFNFYAPLPYYFGAILNIVGFDALAATKLMIAGGILLSAVTMYLLLVNISGKEVSIAGAILYLYAPYRAIDAYVRGATGELYAMVFLPLVLLGIIKILQSYYSSGNPDLSKGKSRSFIGNSSRQARTIRQGIFIGSLAFAGILLSHNIIGMLTGYFLIFGLLTYFIYLTFTHKKLSVICYLLSVILLGFGLAAFFVIPAVAEKNYTRVNQLTEGMNNFSNHFVYLDQLWSSPWGFAGSAPGRMDGMSFMIGKIQLALGLFSILVFMAIFKKKKINKFQFFPHSGILGAVIVHKFEKSIGTIFLSMLVIFFTSVFFMLEISKPWWNLIPGFSFIQYPWRFLTFTTISLPIMISIALGYIKKPARLVITAVIIVVVIWFNSRYFAPKEYLPVEASDYIEGTNLRFKVSKISDEYLPADFIVPKIVSGAVWSGLTPGYDLEIFSGSETPTRKIFQVKNSHDRKIISNVAYFPGWKVKIDNSNVNFISSNGLIEFELPAGIHRIEFIFLDTAVRIIANTIAILSIFLVLYIIVL